MAMTLLDLNITLFIRRRIQKFPAWTYKSHVKWIILRGIYSVIYGEVNISVSGGYVLQYAGDTRDSSSLISVTLRKLFGPETFGPLLRTLPVLSIIILVFPFLVFPSVGKFQWKFFFSLFRQFVKRSVIYWICCSQWLDLFWILHC